MIKAIYIFVAIAVVAGLAQLFISKSENVACPAVVEMCPDGSMVGPTGPKCEFVCPSLPEVTADFQAQIDSKDNLIKITSPVPYGLVNSPLMILGEARGMWFFEGSFPVTLVNWDGLIIAEGVATAEGEWMTEEFVPFTASLTFDAKNAVDGTEGDGNEWPLGSLILRKDNPSGLPENDDALEIPIRFAP